MIKDRITAVIKIIKMEDYFGEQCGFVIENIREYCPDKVQGAFHTHPYIIDLEHFYGRRPTEKEIDGAIKSYKKHGINLTTPSHHDLIDTLLNQCLGAAVGTVCTGSDLDLEKVECWTVKSDKVKARDCVQAIQEHEERIAEEPREWVKPLFDREIINIKAKKWWEL